MTVHHGHMPDIEILNETSAKAIWPMTDQLRDGAGKIVLRGAGHYYEEYEKLNSRRVIKRIKLTRIYLDSKLYTQPVR